MKNKLKKVVAYVLSFMMLFTMSAMNIGSEIGRASCRERV